MHTTDARSLSYTQMHTLFYIVRNIHECSQFGSICLIPTHVFFLWFILLCFSKMSPSTVPIMSFPLTSSILALSLLLVPFFVCFCLFFNPASCSFPILSYDLLLFTSDFNSPSPCYSCMLCGRAYFYFLFQIKKTHRHKSAKDIAQSQCHTCTIHSWSDSTGSVVFIPLKVNFIKTRNKETESINIIH